MTDDLDIEAALIAEALRRYDRFIARGLALSDFTAAKHVAILEAAQRLWELGQTVSVGSVALELQRAGRDRLVDGERGLAALAAGNGKVPDHERLRELTRLRAVTEAATKAAAQARAGDLQGALSALRDVDDLGGTTAITRTAADLCERTLNGVYDQATSEKRRVYLGLRALDNAIGKLPVGGLMTVGADSNTGKSSWTLAMLLAMVEANIPCGLVSMEDPEDVTGARILSSFTTNISSREIQHGRFDVGEQQAASELANAVERVKRLGGKLMFEDRTGETELDVCAAMSRMAARGARLIAVDYVQEISASKTQQDRRNEVRWIAKRLKAHAKRLGVALVLVSQIARPKPGDEYKEPSKHALKESGDLVNMSEVILMLWRETNSDDAPVHVKVAKCKWGGVGLRWTMRRKPNNGAMVEP